MLADPVLFHHRDALRARRAGRGARRRASARRANCARLRCAASRSASCSPVMGGLYLRHLHRHRVRRGRRRRRVPVRRLARQAQGRDAFCGVMAETTATTAMIYGLIFGAQIFSFFIGVSALTAARDRVRRQHALVAARRALRSSCVGYLLLGSLMEAFAVMVITVPIVTPLVLGLGYDLVWWGIIMLIVVETGMITRRSASTCSCSRASPDMCRSGPSTRACCRSRRRPDQAHPDGAVPGDHALAAVDDGALSFVAWRQISASSFRGPSAAREPGIHNHRLGLWIPGSTRPGMTADKSKKRSRGLLTPRRLRALRRRDRGGAAWARPRA